MRTNDKYENFYLDPDSESLSSIGALGFGHLGALLGGHLLTAVDRHLGAGLPGHRVAGGEGDGEAGLFGHLLAGLRRHCQALGLFHGLAPRNSYLLRDRAASCVGHLKADFGRYILALLAADLLALLLWHTLASLHRH